MTKWRYVDLWDPDTDPAQIRMREALALEPTPEPSGRPDAPAAVPGATSRHARIQELVKQIENGNLSATSTLRAMLLDK